MGDEFIHTYFIKFTIRWHYHLNEKTHKQKKTNRKGERSFVASSVPQQTGVLIYLLYLCIPVLHGGTNVPTAGEFIDRPFV